MKLADIKLALNNSVVAEFKHSLYNACGLLSRADVETLFESEIDTIYGENSVEDIPE